MRGVAVSRLTAPAEGAGTAARGAAAPGIAPGGRSWSGCPVWANDAALARSETASTAEAETRKVRLKRLIAGELALPCGAFAASMRRSKRLAQNPAMKMA